jgi:hypothetical protein
LNKKSKNIKEEWVDPDDVPEVDEEWFQNAHVYIGDTLIKIPLLKEVLVVHRLRMQRKCSVSESILMFWNNYVRVVRVGKPA